MLPLAGVLVFLIAAVAAPIGAAAAAAEQAAGAPTYRLSVRDLIEVGIFDEPNLTISQRIDSDGRINLTLVGPVVIAGKTVREAEEYIAGLYIEHRLLRRPMATVRVVDYAPREVSVNGQVASPGMLTFPKERASLDIVEVISRCGGLSSRANGRRVQVTRAGPDGEPVVTEVNVDDLIEKGRGERMEIYPGDVIYVPSRTF